MEKEPYKWVTIMGKHIPVYEGENGEDVFGIGRESDNSTSNAHRFEDDEDEEAKKWFNYNSNVAYWNSDLTKEEISVIKDYVDSSYEYINKDLYAGKPNKKADILTEAINKFELRQPITVIRDSGFEIFGAKDNNQKMSIDDIKQYLKRADGEVSNPAFLSFSAGGSVSYSHKGGNGLRIELDVPSGKGYGAYIRSLSSKPSESEFLVNRDSRLIFDINSIQEQDGNIIIKAKLK